MRRNTPDSLDMLLAKQRSSTQRSVDDIAPHWVGKALEEIRGHDADCDCPQCLALHDICHGGDR
jgi:hypothetical protein